MIQLAKAAAKVSKMARTKAPSSFLRLRCGRLQQLYASGIPMKLREREQPRHERKSLYAIECRQRPDYADVLFLQFIEIWR